MEKKENSFLVPPVIKGAIFDHILSHINPSGPGLLPGGDFLPDDDEYEADLGLIWRPGCYDPLFSFPGKVNPEDKAAQVEKVIKAFEDLCRHPGWQERENLELVLAYPNTLMFIDEALQKLIRHKDLNQSLIYKVCREIFLYSRRRGAVKFCLSVLGLYSVPEDLPLFKIIARHEEFSLYAAVAVSVCCADSVPHLIEMAENVEGWGRIHVVTRLAERKDKVSREFLLRYGCRNAVSNLYTASMIADAVDLPGYLSAEKVEKEIFKGAGVLLEALCESAGESLIFWGIDAYSQGEEAVKLYLSHAKKMATDLEDYMVLSKIGKILDSPEVLEWEPAEIAEMKENLAGLMKDPRWKKLAKKEIRADSPEVRARGLKVLRDFASFDMEEALEALKKNPYDEVVWPFILESSPKDEKFIDALLKQLPDDFISVEILGEKSKGKKPLVVSIDSSRCRYAVMLMQILIGFPGKGEDFILSALKSSCEKLKGAALRTLYFRDGEDFDAALIKSLKKILEENNDLYCIAAGNLLRKRRIFA